MLVLAALKDVLRKTKLGARREVVPRPWPSAAFRRGAPADWSGSIPRRCAASPIRATATYANACGAWRRNGAASATGGSASACNAKAFTRTARSSPALFRGGAWPCAVAAAASARPERGRRWRCRTARTSAGASTSWPTPSPGPPLPHPGHRRRLHPRGLGLGGRHLDRRTAPGARARCAHRPPRQARDHRQRQRHRDDRPAILEWTNRTGLGWHYIAPGKPQQNGFVESFNGRLRDVPERGGLRPLEARAVMMLPELRGPLQCGSTGAKRGARKERRPLASPKIRYGVSCQGPYDGHTRRFS